ncbi:MAG: ABC transporter permease subunit [Candidatus Velthaea sp.]
MGSGLATIVARLALLIPQLFGVALVVFVITHVMPGDPIIALVGDFPAPPEYVAQLRHDLGLDQSLWVQFVDYAWQLAHGNLGYSFAYGDPVIKVIGARIGPTLLLTASALALGSVVGVALGVFAAARHLRASDHVVSALALVGFSIPSFWLSQLLILFFAVRLGWFPSLGIHSLHSDPAGFGAVLDTAQHLLLPTIALAFGHLALIARLTRSSMIETISHDYIRAARAKGLAPRVVLFKHALRNALLPVLTAGGYSVGLLLSSSALVETVFGWPGIGRLLYDSLFRRDYPVLVGIFLVTSLLAILANLVVDVLYTRADPQLRR